MRDDLDSAELLEPGRRYRRATGVRHVFRLPADWMTITFVVHSPASVKSEYPRFLLRSSDGAYEKRLSPKRDLTAGNDDDTFELRFQKLLPGKRYTLTRWDAEHVKRVVFSELDFIHVVDQPRGIDERFATHAYAGPPPGEP